MLFLSLYLGAKPSTYTNKFIFLSLVDPGPHFHKDEIVGAAGILRGLVVLVDDVPGGGHARERRQQEQNRQRAAGHERRSGGHDWIWISRRSI
jgi:hypothetical protein